MSQSYKVGGSLWLRAIVPSIVTSATSQLCSSSLSFV